MGLQLGASGDQGLARVVAGVLHKVLDEAGRQILRLGLPLGSIGVGVARVEDVGVNARQRGRLVNRTYINYTHRRGRMLSHVSLGHRGVRGVSGGEPSLRDAQHARSHHSSYSLLYLGCN